MEEKGIRKKINDALIDEFNALHERIVNELEDKDSRESELCELIRTQISLSMQIIREERSLSGESAYLFQPYAPH